MTRNQQILLIMSWAVSFHGLTLEQAEGVAEIVLDSFDGDIGDATPSTVMNEFNRHLFQMINEGAVIRDARAAVPRPEDYGVVMPPVVESDCVKISDGTLISFQTVAEAILLPGSENIVVHSDYTGVLPGGSLKLASGGVVPALESRDRKKVWIKVFSDPSAIDQGAIDDLVINPPDFPEEPSFVEQKALEAYESLLEGAAAVVEARARLPEHSH